jgi:hypothetical protein
MTPPAPDTLRFVDDGMLFMLWLYDIPANLLVLLIVGTFVILSLIGLGLTHRRIHSGPLASLIENGTAGWFFSGVTVMYGLTLGLVTVATWNSFTAASQVSSDESATIAVLYRDLTGFHQPEQDVLKSELRLYTKYIIEKSWPAQRRGQIHTGESNVLEVFQRLLLTTEPATTGQQIVHTEAIRAFNRVVELRRQRMESIQGSVPGVMWLVVLLGAVATIVSSYWFAVENFGLHALMTGMLAAMIGLLVFLMVSLDHPYWGEVSVGPEAYELVLKQVMNSK